MKCRRKASLAGPAVRVKREGREGERERACLLGVGLFVQSLSHQGSRGRLFLVQKSLVVGGKASLVRSHFSFLLG